MNHVEESNWYVTNNKYTLLCVPGFGSKLESKSKWVLKAVSFPGSPVL